MKILRWLRKTYSGDEFLVKEGDRYFKMKIVTGSRFRDHAFFLDQLQELRELEIGDLILPERVEFGDVLKLYYPFRAEGSVDPRALELEDKKYLVFKLLNLAHALSHTDAKAFAILGFDDILELDDFYFQLPVWMSPQEARTTSADFFVDPYFLETGRIDTSSSIYVIGKMVEALWEGNMPPELGKLVAEMTSDDVEKRPKHVVSPQQVGNSLGISIHRRDYVRLSVPPVGRDALLDFLITKAEEYGSGVHLFHIFGDHGIGKSTFLEMLAHELRDHGYKAVMVRELPDLVESILQVEGEKLEELEPDLQKAIVEFVQRREFNDTVKFAMGIFLQRVEDLVLLVDDYDSCSPDFKLFMKELALSRYESKIICFLTTLVAEDVDFPVDFTLELPPLNGDDMIKLVNFIFDGIPREPLSRVATWLHSLSRGIPGLAVEILRSVYSSVKKSPEEFDPQKVRGLENLVKSRLKSVPGEYVWIWARLALLGNRFYDDELHAMAEVLGVPRHSMRNALEKMMSFGFLYGEPGGAYKFSLEEIREMLAGQVDEAEAKKIYEELFETLEDPWLRAWYLERLGKRRSAAAWHIRCGIRELDERNYLKAKTFFEEALKLLGGEERSYALGMNLAWIYSEVEGRHREAIELLSDHVNVEHLRDVAVLSVLVNSGDVEEASALAENLQSRLDTYPAYLRLRVLHLLLRLMNARGTPSKEIVDLARTELEKFRATTDRHEIVVAELRGELTLARLAETSQIEPAIVEEFQRVMEVLDRRKAWLSLIRLQSEIASHLLPLLPAFAQQLLEQAVERSKKLGIYKWATSLKFELLIHTLYRGQKREFLGELRELRAAARTINNVSDLAMTYFLEAMYHAYNKEYDDALEDLEHELYLELSSGLHRRALRIMAAVYAMVGKFEKSRELINEYRDDPAILHPNFKHFAALIMAENDEEFENAWREFNRESRFWREEALLVFAEKMVKLDRDMFLESAFELEESNAIVGMMISLALIYEALGKAFWADGERLKARGYLERAHALYESMGFKTAANVLATHPAFATLKRLKESLPDWYKVQNLMREEAFFTIRFSKKATSTKAMLEYLMDRLKTVFPVEHVSTVLKRFGRPVLSLGDPPEELTAEGHIRDSFSARPFKVIHSVRIDGEYELLVHLENAHLMLDDETFEFYIEYLNQMEIAMVTTVQFSLARDESVTDPLTGLYTRWYFSKRLDEEFERYKRYGIPFAVIMADIDDFKVINDTYGHPKGDEVLKFVAAVVSSAVRTTDIVGRYGGEEFIVILTNTVKDRGIEVAEKLRTLIKSKNPFHFPITLSFGVAGVPDDEVERAADLVALADKALYVSKNTGKDRVTSA